MNFHQARCVDIVPRPSRQHGRFALGRRRKGKRFALPNSRVMIHQPLISGGLGGQASDIEIHARELLKLKTSSTACWPSIAAGDLADLRAPHRPRQLYVG